MNRSSKIGMGCLILFFLPFALVGVVTAVLMVREAISGNWGQAGFLSIFAIVFGGVGFGFIVTAWRGRKHVSEIDRLRAAHPTERWKWRPEWVEGRVESATRRAMVWAWAFAGFWNLVSGPGTAAAMREFALTHEAPLLLALLFPLVGAGLLVWAVRATIRYRKFGVSLFEMARVPAVIGRGIGGILHARFPVMPREGIELKLVCVNRITTGSGDSRSTTERILWQEDRTVADYEQAWGGGGIRVPVVFRLPSDVRESDDRNSSNEIVWRLLADADLPGVDFHAQFDVPVFRTAESDTPLPPETEPVPRVADFRPPTGSRIRVTTSLRGTQIAFPMARNVGAALGVTAFTAVSTIIVWFLFRSDAPAIFAWVFGFFDALMLMVVASLWLGHSTVWAGTEAIRVTSGIAFLTNTKVMASDQLKEVEVKIGMTAGNTPYYDVFLRGRSGRDVKAGSSIKDKRHAEWLARTIKRAAGRD